MASVLGQWSGTAILPAAGTITIPADVRPDDLLVWIGIDASSVSSVPAGVNGLGATWSQVAADGRTAVFVGRGAVAGSYGTGAVTTSGGGIDASRLFLLRDAAEMFDVATAFLLNTDASTVMDTPAIHVGNTQAILAVCYPCDTITGIAGAGWNYVTSGTNKAAYAVPNAVQAGTFDVQATRSSGSRSLVRVVVGAPPPGPPVNVTVTPATDSLSVDWDPPVSGGIATGYDTRLDLGALFPVLTTSTVFGGLTPATGYSVSVRATGPGGVSDWVTVATATLEPVGVTDSAWYRATVTVGSHSWTAERGQAAAFGPVLPLDLGWELPDDQPVPGQPNPDTATVNLVTAEALADVATGTPCRVTVWLDDTPGARPYATVAGEVGDLEVFPQELPNGGLGVRTRLLVVGHETAANAYTVGAQPWPAESGDARAARIMAEAGQLPWHPSTPVGNSFAERPARTTPKGQALSEALGEAAVYVAGRYSPPARHLWRAVADDDGRLDDYTADLVAAQTTAIDVVDGAWVNRAASWRRTRRRDGAWIQVTTPTGVRVYGRVTGPPMPPATLQVLDTDAWADLQLSSLFSRAWLSGEWFRVHLHAGAPITYGLDWFRRDSGSAGFPWAGRAVVLANIQVMPGLFDRYAGMLAGARVVIEQGGRVSLLFRLRPDVPAWSTVTPRWLDENPAATWADEPPTATWADLRTTPREDA